MFHLKTKVMSLVRGMEMRKDSFDQKYPSNSLGGFKLLKLQNNFVSVDTIRAVKYGVKGAKKGVI